MTINNNNIFGAFTLNEARGSRLTGDWLNKESVANYGWFGGGRNGSLVSVATVDRIDFSNDSVNASPRGSLNVARTNSAATGNSNYGWFGSGFTPTLSVASTVERIDFSNDSATTSVRSSSLTTLSSATGNSNYGWFAGDNQTSGLGALSRIDFSNDTSIVTAFNALFATNFASATGNSNYGWFGGGFPAQSTINRVDFSNDSSGYSLRTILSQRRDDVAATGNSNYGWWGGGLVPFPFPAVQHSVVDRIDFSNDTSTVSVRGPLSSIRYGTGATGNSNFGWFGGGRTGSPISTVATVDRIDFSNDSVTASPRGGTLSGAKLNSAATSGVLNIRRQKAGNYGWFGGGNSRTISNSTPYRFL
jgi:hypothetical protein